MLTYSATLPGISVGFVGDNASDAVTFEAVNGLLKHDRFTAVDPGFASDFDFERFRSENLRGGWQTWLLPEPAARDESRSQRIAPDGNMGR